jgi:hypothetical protein
LRYEIHFADEPDNARWEEAVRAAFRVPAEESVFVGPGNDAPAGPDAPAVQVRTRRTSGEFSWGATIVVTDPALVDEAYVDRIRLSRGLASGFALRAAFPDDPGDPGSWLVAGKDGALTQVRVDEVELAQGQLRITEEVHPAPVPVSPAEPVIAPARIVRLDALLAARAYLRDQLLAAAATACPAVDPLLTAEGDPSPVDDWRPDRVSHYTCSIEVRTSPQQDAVDASSVVAAIEALTARGWQVEDLMTRDGQAGGGADASWLVQARRDGYGVYVALHRNQGILIFGGRTPSFRIREWEAEGASA